MYIFSFYIFGNIISCPYNLLRFKFYILSSFFHSVTSLHSPNQVLSFPFVHTRPPIFFLLFSFSFFLFFSITLSFGIHSNTSLSSLSSDVFFSFPLFSSSHIFLCSTSFDSTFYLPNFPALAFHFLLTTFPFFPPLPTHPFLFLILP